MSQLFISISVIRLASVTFDGGGPDGGATITGTGDPREIPTFVTLIKNKMRARGILVNHNELEGDSIEEARRADKMGIARKKVTYDKGEETRNPNPDRGSAPSFKPEGGEEKARQQRSSQKGGDRTEKVRGERTPMPPRGDKRREDFERLYAANVR